MEAKKDKTGSDPSILKGGRSSGIVKKDKSNMKIQNLTRTSEFSKTKRVQNINDKLDKECIYAVVNKPQKIIKDQEVNKISQS